MLDIANWYLFFHIILLYYHRFVAQIGLLFTELSYSSSHLPIAVNESEVSHIERKSSCVAESGG